MERLSSDPVVLSNEAAIEQLRHFTGENCQPKAIAVENFQASRVAVTSGHIIAAGKSAIINGLSSYGWQNIPSWTNRRLRPGEVQGVDKWSVEPTTLLKKAEAGDFLELEEVRSGVFYGTGADFNATTKYLKDTELQGAFSLRALKPDLRIIIPLPPATIDPETGVRSWEKRIIDRERFSGYSSDETFNDITVRLKNALPDLDAIEQEDLLRDPYILVVINDDLEKATAEAARFLEGEQLTQKRKDIRENIKQLREFIYETLE